MNSAADHRPERRRDRAGGRHEPVRARPLGLPKFEATSATIAGMISTAPMPSRNDQPMISTVRFGASAVVKRPARVDDAPDRERALAADDLADLPAGDHQRRHHQRVERDRRLDPGHGGPDVLGDRRDRRVHHRRVEGHHELPRRQRQQDDPGRAGPPLGCLGHSSASRTAGSRLRPGRQKLTRPATSVTRKTCPVSISSTEKIWPAWWAGIRLPYPVVVRVV